MREALHGADPGGKLTGRKGGKESKKVKEERKDTGRRKVLDRKDGRKEGRKTD